MISAENSSRRNAVKTGMLAFGGMIISSPETSRSPDDDEKLIRHEMRAIAKLVDGQYQGLWANMQGITEAEVDWKMHPEANTIRWIIGHLTWFDEWVADAMNESGLYTEGQGPQSFQHPSFANMKERFENARNRLTELTGALKPEQLKQPVRFVPNKKAFRYDLTLHDVILSIHPTHLAGHRYQIRYIRGTYSRFAKTDKTNFDEF